MNEHRSEPSLAERSLALLKRTAPWAIAASILWLLFRRIPFTEALTAASQAELRVFIPAALIAVTLWFWLESGAFAYLFSRFNAPLSWGEARSLRGLTYLLTPINWNLGTGAIVLHLRQSKRVAPIEATSSLLFYGLIDGVVLMGLAIVGVAALPPSPPINMVRWIASVLLAVQSTLLVFFLLRGPQWRWVQRIKAVRVFKTHSNAVWRDVAVLLSIRLTYFAGFILFFWAGTRAFGVAVPLPHLAAAVPIILMIGGLPITPAGLGTQQAAMLYFFSPYGSDADILAFGLAFPVSLILSRLPISVLYLRDLAALRASQSVASSAE